MKIILQQESDVEGDQLINSKLQSGRSTHLQKKCPMEVQEQKQVQ